MIYTYLDADQLCYAARALRFAYNSMMVRVTAFRLSCVVEAMPCFCPQVHVNNYENFVTTGGCFELYTYRVTALGCLKKEGYGICTKLLGRV